MNVTTDNEFPVDLSSGVGQGTLIVTDARLLIRPAGPNQYYRYSNHNSSWAHQLLDLGDTGSGMDVWHIVTDLNLTDAYKLLGPVFHSYVDYYCLSKIYIDAEVNYIGLGGTRLRTESYGMADDHHTKTFNVYCNGFLPYPSDWRPLIKRCFGLDPASAVPGDKLEDYLASVGYDTGSYVDRVVVLRPDASMPDGVSARGVRMTY